MTRAGPDGFNGEMLSTLYALVGFLVAAAPAPASSARGLVLMDASSSLAGPAQASLRDSLRGEIERSIDFRWVDPPAISLDELAIALNCDGMDDVCIRKAGAAINADAALLVRTAPAPRQELVFMLVQLNPPRPTRMAAVPVRDGAPVLADARRAVRSLLGPAKSARLVVVTQPAGAALEMDGEPRGASPANLDDIAPGQHRVTASKDGFLAQSVDVALQAGETRALEITLPAAAPVPQAATATASPPAPAPAPTPAPLSPEPAGRPGGFPLARGLVGGGLAVVLASVGALLAGVLLVPSGPIAVVGIAAGTWVARDPMMAVGLNQRLALEFVLPYFTPVAMVAGGALAAVALLVGAAGGLSVGGGAAWMVAD